MLPLVLGLRPAEVRQTLRDASWPALAGAFALLIAANLLVFAQSRFPVLFLVMPPSCCARAARRSPGRFACGIDFEKASSGKMRFDLRTVAVDDLIDRCIGASRFYAERLGVTIEARQRAPGSLIRVDDGRFHQIMANLLSNAAKFSRTGGSVEVDASARDGRCRISVIDHGHGIPAAFRKELFERSSQTDSSDGRSRSGTGLGMAIAKHLTEQMSGRISLGVGRERGNDLPPGVPARELRGRRGVVALQRRRS